MINPSNHNHAERIVSISTRKVVPSNRSITRQDTDAFVARLRTNLAEAVGTGGALKDLVDMAEDNGLTEDLSDAIS